jgi:hypothetical protein
MRSVWIGVLVGVLAGAIPTSAQQTSQATSQPAAPQDPQAVSVLNQALVVAGGTSAIRAIQDYTGSGNITYPSEQDAQGTVTVIGMRSTEFRMDANLPTGVRSWAVSDGEIARKSENGTISRMVPQGPVPSSDAFPFQTPLFPGSIAFPYRQLAAMLNNPRFNISYKGLVEIDGHSVHDVQLERMPVGAVSSTSLALQPRTRDVFIDASTLQMVMTKDIAPNNAIHELRYSDYRAVNGVLMPFSIAETIGGQQTWTIQLSQIRFNTGLQNSSFALQ